MKTWRRPKIYIILLAAVFLAIAVVSAVYTFSPKKAKASSGYDYLFSLENYDVTYDISPNCEIEVTEVLKVRYEGRRSTGFYRDIPVNGGARVKNLKVEGAELINGGTEVPYDVSVEDNDFLTVDIGDTSLKTGKTETYRLTYLYCIGNSVVKSGLLPIVPVGTGWQCDIENARVTLILPDGYLNAKRYVGYAGDENHDSDFSLTDENGRKVIRTEERNLGYGKGVTFDLAFEKGALTPYSDFTPYIFVLIAAALLLATVLIKLLFFNKIRLMPVVNFEAPEGMDPLIMGKLIDNKVNSEDVTSLIFYWADKGYLKINLDGGDPTLIRLKNLPDNAESYEKIVFSGLFRYGDSVRTGNLRNSFYSTYERASSAVNGKAKGLYNSVSIGVSIMLALLAGLLAGFACLILPNIAVSARFLYFFGFGALIPALVLYALSETVAYNRLKNPKAKNLLFIFLLALGVTVCTLILTFAIPGSVMPTAPKVLLLLLCFATVSLSVIIITRTKDYNKKLNEIVGFRNFILFAEKDRLEKLLESDPQYYYHVLPYAQVLNVSDIWEDKFKEITVAPPVWATYSAAETVLDFMIINSLIRSSAAGLARGIISRPSSSGANGFSGHFGGFSGGGFGGGGGRGR